MGRRYDRHARDQLRLGDMSTAYDAGIDFSAPPEDGWQAGPSIIMYIETPTNIGSADENP